ncbi:MAG: MFS transporter [Hyphomicrobiales bacterium]|nr:MFS transporter [Hyphomicrobiales bacterium]
MVKNKHNAVYIIINVFIPFMAAYFLSELFRNINGVIGENIGRELQLSATELGFLTSLFFISIAGSQLFVGICLDRYGARRTISVLLLVGAVGAFLFSFGTFTLMGAGRFLLGLGMAGCWTAAFKVNAQWWPKNKLAFANGAIISFAGIGALCSTLPTQYILSFITWQELFQGLSGFTACIAAYVYLVAPDHEDDIHNTPKNLFDEIKGYSVVFKNHVFVWIAPLSIVCQGVWLSYQGLWAGEWLRQVDQLPSAEAAAFLLLLAVCVISGNFILGAVTDRLGEKGYSRVNISLVICFVYILVQVFILMNMENISPYLWGLFGFCVSGSIITYALLSNALPTGVAGRAVSILNLFATLAGFCLQYGVGFILDLWQPVKIGTYPAVAHQTAIACIVVMQLVALVWAFYGTKVQRHFKR